MIKFSLKNGLLLVLAMSILLIYFIANPNSSSFFPSCPLYSFTGVYCPGCGSQRAFHALLHFDFVEILRQNILFLLGCFVLVYSIFIAIMNTYFNKKYKNYMYQKETLLVFLALIILFWVLRNIPYYPFYLLAPH